MQSLSWIHNKNHLLFYETFLLSVPGTKTKLIDTLPMTTSPLCSTVPHIKRKGSCCEQVMAPHNARSHTIPQSFSRASRVTCLDTRMFEIYQSRSAKAGQCCLWADGTGRQLRALYKELFEKSPLSSGQAEEFELDISRGMMRWTCASEQSVSVRLPMPPSMFWIPLASSKEWYWAQ